MIELTVKLFGPAARVAHTSTVVVRVEHETATAAEVMQALREQHPTIASHVGAARLAVNQEFAAPHTPVHTTDELALIGQVSGG